MVVGQSQVLHSTLDSRPRPVGQSKVLHSTRQPRPVGHGQVLYSTLMVNQILKNHAGADTRFVKGGGGGGGQYEIGQFNTRCWRQCIEARSAD